MYPLWGRLAMTFVHIHEFQTNLFPTLLSPTSIVRHKDGLDTWGGTEIALDDLSTTSKRHAGSFTSSFGAVGDVGGSHETGSPRPAETGAGSLVNNAVTAADVCNTAAAGYHRAIKGITACERLFGPSNEGKCQRSAETGVSVETTDN
ncbi:hypothetical protein EYR40_008960 [Pleurotus pulmonarius]|nr:hypothetical protein EYR36_009783 [Pleurotus pulmonarius]KAF4594157.1 hypothetical protein EYR40_008960 [Pleurotus pulmonarius]